MKGIPFPMPGLFPIVSSTKRDVNPIFTWKNEGAELPFHMCLARTLIPYSLELLGLLLTPVTELKASCLQQGVREPQELIPEVSMALAAPPQGPVSAL